MSAGLGGLRIGLKVVARNPCPDHGFVHTETDSCQKGYLGTTIKEHDMGLYAFAATLIANAFATNNTATSVPDITNTNRSFNANSAVSAILIVAGSGVTTPTFGDYQIQTQIASSSGSISATVNPTITNNTTNGTFTITGTFTNSTGSNATYGNIGIYATANTFSFMFAHDLTNGATGYVVSPAGTVAVTYTVTIS